MDRLIAVIAITDAAAAMLIATLFPALLAQAMFPIASAAGLVGLAAVTRIVRQAHRRDSAGSAAVSHDVIPPEIDLDQATVELTYVTADGVRVSQEQCVLRIRGSQTHEIIVPTDEVRRWYEAHPSLTPRAAAPSPTIP